MELNTHNPFWGGKKEREEKKKWKSEWKLKNDQKQWSEGEIQYTKESMNENNEKKNVM